MNTLLSEERANFVEKSGIAGNIWSRECVLEYIDREVYEAYKEVNYVFFILQIYLK